MKGQHLRVCKLVGEKTTYKLAAGERRMKEQLVKRACVYAAIDDAVL